MEALNTIRPELLTLSGAQLSALMPYLVVFGGTLLTILVSASRKLNPKWPVFILTLATAVAGIVSSVDVMHSLHVGTTLFNGMMASDGYSLFFNVLFLSSAIVTVLASFRYLDHEKLQYPEYFVLVLFSALGMMLMSSCLDLISIFIALEIMSLSVYVLVGFRRADRRSNEAALKYFILGSAASAVLLYGTALIYGATGTTNLQGVLSFIKEHQQSSPLFTLGAWLVISGFLFKVAAAPFHMWMPDVYEGAPTPVTGFMTTGLKAASFATFLRVFLSLGYGHAVENAISSTVQAHVHNILWACAVLTMLVGNVIALTQTHLKRMLAYSSIAHTGYLLIGILSGAQSEQGYAPVVMYLVAYAIMNLGAFIILGVLAKREDSGLNLHHLSGLSRRQPVLAFAMAVFMFSMAGVPPTAGFAAKYWLFYSAVQANEIPLVIIAVLCSAISVYYYLRVLVYIYMKDPVESPGASRMSVWSAAAIAAMVLLTLQIGVLPEKVVSAAKKAVQTF